MDTYTHTTGDMHRKAAAEIVGGFLTDYLGEEMAPWQSAENAVTAVVHLRKDGALGRPVCGGLR